MSVRSSSPSPRQRRLRADTLFLLLIVAFLLLQFFLRVHNITHQPFFVDEHRHITRAAAAFDGHPARESMGKFLLYIWLYPFQDDITTGLHVSRSAVALFSLIGAAALFAVSRQLFNRWVALLALAFYSLAPLSLFYERMVLADGVAAALGTLTAWQSVRLARRPSYHLAIVVGVLVGMAFMAKLVMTFGAALPVMAVLFLGSHVSWKEKTGTTLARMGQWFFGRARRYFPYLVVAGVACIVIWLPVLIPAAITGAEGEYYVLIDQSLLDYEDPFVGNDVNKFEYLWDQIGIMLSAPLLWVLVLMSGLGLWKCPGKTAFVLSWLLLLWVPNILLVTRIHTRYLMPGTYPLAVVFTAGTYALTQIRWASFSAGRRSRLAWTGVAGVLSIWAVLFAIPFAVNASTDTSEVEVPIWDQNDYFRNGQNAYAVTAAMDHLAAQGKRDGEQVRVTAIMELCQRFELYDYPDIDLVCSVWRYPKDERPHVWAEIVTRTRQDQPLYLIVENYREVPFTSPEVNLHFVRDFQRPKDGLWVTIWQVCRTDNLACLAQTSS